MRTALFFVPALLRVSRIQSLSADWLVKKKERNDIALSLLATWKMRCRMERSVYLVFM